MVLHNRSISLLLYDDDELFSGLHLAKYFPLTPFTVGEVAKNTLVSAPFLIEIAPIFFARFSPIPTIPVLLSPKRVLTKPGCRVFTVIGVSFSNSANLYVNMMFISFDRL